MTRNIALLGSSALTGFASGTPITPAIAQRSMAAHRHYGTTEPRDPMLRRSPDSAAMLPFWDKVDAVMDGIDGMRNAREEYLPKFTDEEECDYNFRLSCTTMTNVYRDVVEGLAGKPFEQPVVLRGDDTPDDVKLFMEDVDGSGNVLTVFAGMTFFNGINNSLDWIFVDYDAPDPDLPAPRNRAEEKERGMRPYWSHIIARNVIDVESKVINSKEVLTYFKVYEPGAPDHIREFVRDDNGVVTWRLFRREKEQVGEGEDKTYFVETSRGVVTIGVIPMVPFVTGRRNGRSWKVDPPLKDALDLQVELYEGESDLKFAKKLTAFPMLAANGIAPLKNADGTPKKLAVGPSRVLYSGANDTTGKTGSWTYVEPSAESLKFLASENHERIQQLRELGKQPLTAQSGNITVITAMVAAGKSKSAVKAWAFILKDALENALILTAKWMGITDYNPDVYVHINFDDYSEGEDLDALATARSNKDISRETYWEELGRRGVLSSNFDPEQEERRLLDERPADGEDVITK